MNSEEPCVFCNRSELSVHAEGKLLFAIEDSHPVTNGHLLIIPKIHRKDFFALSREEFSELDSFLKDLRDSSIDRDPSITGFNIGANCGTSAGQTVFHCHIHFIPRRDGDVESPRGGVRGVIPSKQSY